MKALLYRRRLDVRSGAGQLVRMQADGLRSAGARVQLACQRGSLKFFFRTGWPVRPLSQSGVRALNNLSTHVVVDHEMELPGADLVFVHSLESELDPTRDGWSEKVARETVFFKALTPTTPIVANSQLIRAALIRHFDVDAERILVHYPGFQSEKFEASGSATLRRAARQALKLDDQTPLVGFVTSGDFHTRGLDTFLSSAEQIAQVRPDVNFLIVGSKRLPDWAVAHPLTTAGRVHYRPKSGKPELWLAALDIFLYPARFEAFGMVISEAQALGIPVLTSRRVGASECLPSNYAPWLIEKPDSNEFAAKVLSLLADKGARRKLISAGIERVRAFDQHHYVRETIATIMNQKR